MWDRTGKCRTSGKFRQITQNHRCKNLKTNTYSRFSVIFVHNLTIQTANQNAVRRVSSKGSNFLLTLQVHTRVGRDDQDVYWCHRDWSHPNTWRGYEVYMLVLVLIIPALIMTFAYTALISQLGHVLGQRDSFVRATQV